MSICMNVNELLETDYTMVVAAGQLRKLWDSLSELRSSLYERRLKRAVLRPELWACQNCAVYTVFFFPSGISSQSKIAQFN
jgi:hypothetical protein